MPKLNYNQNELNKLLQYFHELTGVLIALYDNQYRIITSYPSSDCTFCNKIKSTGKGLEKCLYSDLSSFKASKKNGECVIYTCHTGLIEATAPIVEQGVLIGYLMLGQVSNAHSLSELETLLDSAMLQNGITDLSSCKCATEIPLQTDTQIQAAAKIMEACISYILYKELISIKRQNFEKNINSYLLSHLEEDLSVDRICQELKISRRKLYEYSDTYLRCTIAKHIKNLRVSYAKKLLRETTLPITVISEKCGFTDYNYFCRIFKKETQLAARTYRARYQT